MQIEMWPISRVKPYPHNPRINTAAVAAVVKSIREFGFRQPIVVDAEGVVVVGHTRLKAAKKLKIKTVPVHVATDLTAAQVQAYRLADNRTAEFAEWDMDVLPIELDQLRAHEFDLDIIGFEIEEPAEKPEEPLAEEPAPEFKGVWGLMSEIRFPSSNPWELPDLRPDMLSDIVPAHVYDGVACAAPAETLFVWGTAKFEKERHAGGVLAFYVDDERFESIWGNAVQHVANWVRFGWGAIISPDFSMWRNDPLAVQMWAMFRSRWLARYWQEVGLKVIPSLNWSDERTHEWAFAGIPRGAPVVSCQCRTVRTKPELAYFMKGITSAVRTLEPGKVLVYGGATNRANIEPLVPDGPEYVWLDDWTAVRRRRGAMTTKNAKDVGNGGGGRSGNSPRVGGRIIGPV